MSAFKARAIPRLKITSDAFSQPTQLRFFNSQVILLTSGTKIQSRRGHNSIHTPTCLQLLDLPFW